MNDLAGQVAIVTGAGAGIGAAIASRYAASGASVAVFDIDGVAAAQIVTDICACGHRAYARRVDVGSLGDVEGAIAEVVQTFGPPTLLVNNAAVRTQRAPITELAVSEWDLALRTNLTGAFYMCRTAIPFMIACGGGTIINVASQLGSVGIEGAAAYCASKGALLQLTRVLALDHAADGIRVNALSPGAVMTERLVDVFGSEEAALARLSPLHPAGRIGHVDEIAKAALFLAAPGCAFMTGADLVVDGGYLAR